MHWLDLYRKSTIVRISVLVEMSEADSSFLGTVARVRLQSSSCAGDDICGDPSSFFESECATYLQPGPAFCTGSCACMSTAWIPLVLSRNIDGYLHLNIIFSTQPVAATDQEQISKALL